MSLTRRDGDDGFAGERASLGDSDWFRLAPGYGAVTE